MKKPTQDQLCYKALSNISALNNFVVQSLNDGSIPPNELLKLIALHPEKYGKFKGIAEKMKLTNK
jgi:hypothetical protein